MAFVMAEVGAVTVLTAVRDNYAAPDWWAAPYVNNKTPAVTDTKASYTPAPNIAPIGNFGLLYSAPAGDGTGAAEMHIDDIAWPGQTIAQTIIVYGFFVYDSDNVLVIAERFAAPVTLTLLGEILHAPNHVFRCHS